MRVRDLRRHGWALDDGQFQEGVCCIAAPFFRSGGSVVGSISVFAPAARFTAARHDITDAVRESALRTSEILGYDPDLLKGSAAQRKLSVGRLQGRPAAGGDRGCPAALRPGGDGAGPGLPADSDPRQLAFELEGCADGKLVLPPVRRSGLPQPGPPRRSGPPGQRSYPCWQARPAVGPADR